MKRGESEKIAIEVLLIEDTPGDVRLAQEAFRESGRCVHLHVATDGVQGVSFLRREGAYAKAPRPALILLDLNMPKMNGWEVLTAIKSDRNLKIIPTIILTTSDAEVDVMMSYRLQANCYLLKPDRWDALDKLIKSINAFWLTDAKLPQQTQSE